MLHTVHNLYLIHIVILLLLGETSQLLQEKVSHLTEREEVSDKFKLFYF